MKFTIDPFCEFSIHTGILTINGQVVDPSALLWPLPEALLFHTDSIQLDTNKTVPEGNGHNRGRLETGLGTVHADEMSSRSLLKKIFYGMVFSGILLKLTMYFNCFVEIGSPSSFERCVFFSIPLGCASLQQ